MADTLTLPAVTNWSADPVLAWLIGDGRMITNPVSFGTEFGRELLAAGAPVWRVRLGQRILDPLIGAEGVIWRREQAMAEHTSVPHGYRDTPMYEGSPGQHVIETQRPYRQRLDRLDPQRHHTLLFELAAEGATDYLCLPAVLTDGAVQLVAYATDRPGGFTDSDLARFDEVNRLLVPILEVITVRLTMSRLLETYLGRGIAHQVLAGAFRRGDVQFIKAAIMYADLRGYTELTARLEPPEVLDALSDFFGAVVEAVEGADGEVLKFMGDAVLALFPAPPDAGAEAACAAAMDAVTASLAGMAAVNAQRAEAGQETLDFGLTLDLGYVAYGNVGGPDRLDFTAIGSAVNKVSRMQELCKSLGEPVLMSHLVARFCGGPVE
ncbi:MAG: adenylate/guanylate cyclase domain-containing protein, partial [Rhodospirillaceae bacterium]|nr:adenylate/guanylate cyclase domain-containing protein [Rhodospirillaceae bacterium]